MSDALQVIGFVTMWLLLQYWLLPKLGVST